MRQTTQNRRLHRCVVLVGVSLFSKTPCVWAFVLPEDQFLGWKAHQLAKDVEACFALVRFPVADASRVLLSCAAWGIGARKNRQVNLYPHSSVEDLASEDALELEYKHWVHHDAASTGLPLKLFEAAPVVGKRVVTMEVARI